MWQAQKIVDSSIQLIADAGKGAPALVLAFDRDGVGETPVDFLRVARKRRT
jgi:hypothetical protein